MMKIFEIGVAKTGTVSLGIAFKILGFTHKGFSEECYLPEPYPNWTKEDSWPVMCEVADKYESLQMVLGTMFHLNGGMKGIQIVSLLF